MFIASSKDLTHSAFSLPWASIKADFINSAPVLMMIMLMIRMIWRHKTMNGRYMGISYGGGIRRVAKSNEGPSKLNVTYPCCLSVAQKGRKMKW